MVELLRAYGYDKEQLLALLDQLLITAENGSTGPCRLP